jgi:hypothetical protein
MPGANTLISRAVAFLFAKADTAGAVGFVVSWYARVGMARHEKTLERVLSGVADANVGFEDFCNLLRTLGFAERSRGSHRVFRRTGIEEIDQPAA